MTNPDDRPLVVGTTRARHLLGVGKTKLFELLPELDSYLEGSKRMVTVASIEALIAKRLAAKKKAA